MSMPVAAAVIAMIASFAAQQRKVYSAARSAGDLAGGYAAPRRGNTDPDPNVRSEIMRQQNWRKGG